MAKRGGTNKLSLSRNVITGPKVSRKGGTNVLPMPHSKVGRGYKGAGYGQRGVVGHATLAKKLKTLHNKMGGPGMTRTNPAVPRAY